MAIINITADDIKRNVHALASKHDNIKHVYLVGSYSQGKNTLYSDIDLVIEFFDNYDNETYWGFLFGMEKETSRGVNLLTMEAVQNSPLRDGILNSRILIYTKSE